jgi:hypothetical protein
MVGFATGQHNTGLPGLSWAFSTPRQPNLANPRFAPDTHRYGAVIRPLHAEECAFRVEISPPQEEACSQMMIASRVSNIPLRWRVFQSVSLSIL